MKRENRNINIFSISFLDLLSGALAAVIILFIIVPKLDAESLDAIEILAELNLRSDELAEMVDQLEDSVDRQIYEELQARIRDMQNALEQARNVVGELESENETLLEEVKNISSELTETIDELTQAQQDLQNTNDEITDLKQRISELEEEVRKQDDMGSGHTALLGVSAEFAILAFWTEDVDIDIHFTNLSSGEVCNFRNDVTPFGRLLEDITSSPGEEGYELIYQQELMTGRYMIEVHWYDYHSRSIYSAINVDIEIIFMPFKANEQIIRKSKSLTGGTLTFITNITINQSGIL